MSLFTKRNHVMLLNYCLFSKDDYTFQINIHSNGIRTRFPVGTQYVWLVGYVLLSWSVLFTQLPLTFAHWSLHNASSYLILLNTYHLLKPPVHFLGGSRGSSGGAIVCISVFPELEEMQAPGGRTFSVLLMSAFSTLE